MPTKLHKPRRNQEEIDEEALWCRKHQADDNTKKNWTIKTLYILDTLGNSSDDRNLPPRNILNWLVYSALERAL
jgi:hypothetical protein